MIFKAIIYCGQAAAIGCDEKCDKAWGISSRPKRQLSDNPDDYELLADDELPQAPADPGTYEGGCAKPTIEQDKLNKWCARECERCTLTGPDMKVERLDDFTKPLRNIK